ncbi:hypothetical protein [Yoonia sp. BS5-3]|uniref:Uncharacterized protein n=1 Tax=Yoonia phaeophyticola TaxID=3137369 RepID=A0ABZ2V5W1_9RHOB
MSNVISKDAIPNPRMRLFPLSPEAVRRLRGISEFAKTPEILNRRHDNTATHENDLQRRMIGQ